MPVGCHVLVEQDRLIPVWPAGHPDPDAVRAAFFGPGGVPVVAAFRGDREVGLLGSVLDLVEDRLAKSGEMIGHRRCVGILRFEIRDHLGVVAIPHP